MDLDPYKREGGTLAQWLPLLVSANPDDRTDAAEAIGGMWKGTPTYSSNDTPGAGGAPADFDEAVRRAVDSPGFRRTDFVRKLTQLRIDVSGTRDAMRPPGMVSYLVFQALGEPLIDAADLLGEMLGDRANATYAREALARIGPAAKQFLPALLRELDATGEEGFEGARALASVGRGDASLIDSLIERLGGPHPAVQVAAAEVIEELAPDLAGREDRIIGALRCLLTDAKTWAAGLAALASVGRDRADVMRLLVEYARPRPPRWGTVKKGKYAKAFDEVLAERAVAIVALKNFTRFPADVVPALTDAIDTFEEFDADRGHENAEHGRVIDALSAFDPVELVPAVPTLVRHIRQSGDDAELDQSVIRLLGRVGTLAAEALPALEREWAASNHERSALWTEGAAPTPEADPLPWAIARIHGELP